MMSKTRQAHDYDQFQNGEVTHRHRIFFFVQKSFETISQRFVKDVIFRG